MTPTVPDGPDTELAAAIAWFDERPARAEEIEEQPEPETLIHAATIVRAVLARPAAGRDLTGDDVRTAFERWEKSGDGFGEHAGSYVAGLLNGIARPAVARTDGTLASGMTAEQEDAELEAMHAAEVARTDGPTNVAGAERPANGSAPGVGASASTDGQPPADGYVSESSGEPYGPGTVVDVIADEINTTFGMSLSWPRISGTAHRAAARLRREGHLCAYDATPSAAPADDTAAPDMPAIVAGVERSYVEALNAILAAPGGSDDVDRWRGQAEAYRTVAERLRRDHGMARVEYGSGEWRRTHGVQPVRDSQDGGDRG